MTAGGDAFNAAAALVERGAASRTALVCGDRSMSWGELRVAVARAGAAWRDCGVERGEVVQLHLAPGLEQAVAYLGAIWAGGVPVPLCRSGRPHRGHPWDPQAPSRFILAPARDGYADAWRDSVVTLAEWAMYLADSGAAPARPMRAEQPACWTEARTADGAGARLLAHGFARAPSPARAGGPAHTASVLGMLNVLRRGGTAVIAGAQSTRGALAEALS